MRASFLACFAGSLVLLALQPRMVQCVDRSKFRTCKDTGFCRRNRDRIPASSAAESYKLDMGSIKQAEGAIRGTVTHGAGASAPLNLMISVCAAGAVRVQLSEAEERWQPTDLLMADGLVSGSFSLLSAGDTKLPVALRSLASTDLLAVSFNNNNEDSTGNEGGSVLAVHSSPLKFELYHQGVLQVVANGRSMMHFETRQPKAGRVLLEAEGSEAAAAAAAAAGGGGGAGDDVDRHQGKEVVDYGEDGLAVYADGTREEKKVLAGAALHDSDQHVGDSFGGHSDTASMGPMSVGMDFAFPFAQHVYGIPQHTSPLSLPTTKPGLAGTSAHYNDPYRLYNLDVFEYELDQPMALYGHIPLMLAHGLVENKGRSSGVFWFNPSETFIDVLDSGTASKPYKDSHWLSESGNVDFFLLPGPTPAAVHKQFTSLTGRQQLPPLFSLGYHQCRWNYRDEKDVATVEATFEQLDYPFDVLWLDIEHTNGKRYFTWDKNLFPSPLEMQANLTRHGRKMVTIVDPHIKRDDNYHVHKEATSLGLYIKNKEGSDFDGWCWPGSSSYLDFTTPKVRDWWAKQFSLENYEGSTLDLFTWNDMNEPSVFNGPEVSMPKDAKNLQGVEHREWHSLYGIYMQMATAQGLQQRTPAPPVLSADALASASASSLATRVHQLRPFVLSRAFWAGSQRHGAIWTGDNTAEWGHLRVAAPMLLSINLAGLSFAGSDVGGFFGEPGPELFVRWYQVGAFTPFFRGHAHHDTKRREPWSYGEPYTNMLRSVAMLRYSLLPFWYSTFYETYTGGLPVMRTLFTEFPDDPATFAMESQWMIGTALLVAPVTHANTHTKEVYLPAGSGPWYCLHTNKMYNGGGATGRKIEVAAPLETIPVFVRGGSIVPRKMRLRRSSRLMFWDPYTLLIAPDETGKAHGKVYLDDERSMAHEVDGTFALRHLEWSAAVEAGSSSGNRQLVCSGATGGYTTLNTVERIIITGQTKAPKRVVLHSVSTSEGSETEQVVAAVTGEVAAAETAANKELHFSFDEAEGVITIKKPDVKIADGWKVVVEF